MKAHNYWSKLLDFFGLDEVENTTQYSSELQDSNPKVVSLARNKSRDSNYKFVFHCPDSFEKVKNVADDLRKTHPVILNLEKLEKREARKVINFVSGVVYTLNCKIKIEKVGKGVFLFIPGNIEVSGKSLNKDIKNKILGG